MMIYTVWYQFEKVNYIIYESINKFINIYKSNKFILLNLKNLLYEIISLF